MSKQEKGKEIPDCRSLEEKERIASHRTSYREFRRMVHDQGNARRRAFYRERKGART